MQSLVFPEIDLRSIYLFVYLEWSIETKDLTWYCLRDLFKEFNICMILIKLN